MELDESVYEDLELLEKERKEHEFRKIKLYKGKKLQKALIDWYKTKYNVMVPEGKCFFDGIVLKKNPVNDDGTYLVIEVELSGWWIFKRAEYLKVYDVTAEKPLKHIVIHIPNDLVAKFKPDSTRHLDQLDYLICRYFGREPKIHKKRYRSESIEKFLESRELLINKK